MSSPASRRAFSAPVEPLADNWYARPVQSIQVKVLGGFSATADGACPVELPSGAVAFLKPRPGHQSNVVVAREKICADLGHLLDLPVAPVVVLSPEVGARPHHAALSLSCLASGRHWQAGGAKHLVPATPALEALRVFWTWIGDGDHNHHGFNLLYEARHDGSVSVVAIDHAYSLCHGNGQDPLAVKASKGYGTADLIGAVQARDETVERIAALDIKRLNELVHRLGAILTQAEQDRIADILQRRRDRINELLAL